MPKEREYITKDGNPAEYPGMTDRETEVPVIDEIIDGQEPEIPEEIAAEGPKTRREALREMFTENVRTLQKLIPGFYVDPEEIDTYVSEERIRLHDQAVEKVNKLVQIKAQLPDKLPSSFTRCGCFYADTGDTPKGREFNKRLFENIKNPGEKGNQLRKELIADMANRIQDLDESKLSYDRPFDQRAAYVLENLSTLEAGVEFQKTHRDLADSIGLMLSPEQEKHMKLVEGKGVSFGGIGRSIKEVMVTDFFLTVPFDKLPPEKMALLGDNAGLFKTEGTFRNGNPKTALQDQILMAASYNNYKNGNKTVESGNIPKHTYKPDEFINRVPTVEQCREKFAGLLEKLNGTDAWYVKNSDQYKTMVNSVKSLLSELDKVGDQPMVSEQQEKIKKCLLDVNMSARAYEKHAGKSGLNDRRKDRSEIASLLKNEAVELSSNSNPLVFEQFVERHNEASAEEYYQQVKKGQLPGEEEMPTEDRLKAERQEKTFAEGLTRTEKLREETQSLEKKPELTHEDAFLVSVNGSIVEAREELANMVGRSEIDQEKARALMATVMVGNMMKNMLKDKDDGVKLMRSAISGTERSDAFRSVTQNLDSEKINEFLSFDGEMKMLKDYQRMDTMRKSAPHNRTAQQGGPQMTEQNVVKTGEQKKELSV